MRDFAEWYETWRMVQLELERQDREKIKKARAYDHKYDPPPLKVPMRNGRLPQPDMGEDE